ncbi:restriction endonuclease subunit S [Vibrio spartinae]|uniref:Type-1 restriction enzyme EcoKI specificity protein n=1 Tax=Vibrio spartinae TaxID=1918945 RepID=A0A1N6MB23_9VIBR|nr:restriction endonuclease subunit S [Vibrio spartinae]SIO96611.1 Type-1 restriction enzyme EcoKI specificity protein [Vibrio spartinae]
MTALSKTKRYQAYPEYKDSGVECVGSIPIHWMVTSLKRYTYVKGGFAFSSDLFGDVGKPIIRIGDIKQDGSISLESCKYVPEVVAENSQEYLVSNGQLLMAMTGATIGKAGIYSGEYPALVNQRVGRFEVYDDKLSYRFLWYVLKTLGYQEYIRLTAFGGAQPNISDTAMVAYDSAFPPLEEQTQIANFLDHETAKIDTLIEKQQQLIKLLKEKRQAVISHAVTKGLNPQAPMKDSGVEWLGEVPEHWDVGRLGYYSRVINGSTPSKVNLSYWDKKEVPWLSSGSVNQYNITTASDYISEKALKECSVELLPVGTLVMGMIGQGKTRGMSAITRIEATINQNLAAIIPDSRLDSEYGHLVLQAAYNEIRECARGGNQAALNCELISNFKVTIPPIDEQKQIVVDINTKLNRFDQIIKKTMDFVELSQERRTALISAAVTGKIDVRSWQAPTHQEQALEQTA